MENRSMKERFIWVIIVLMISIFTWSSANGQNERDYITKKKERLASQKNDDSSLREGSDADQIKGVVETVLLALSKGDSTGMGVMFAEEARIYTLREDSVSIASPEEFAMLIHSLEVGTVVEEALHVNVKVDDYLASAWVPYTLHQGGKLHHCGVDAFTFYKIYGDWLITQITDSRRTSCNDLLVSRDEEVGKVLDTWHQAASDADLETYFARIADNGVFLGTDAGEYWPKAAFAAFAKPYFERGDAWSFTPQERNIYFSEDNEIAWFDELLDTWMGICRGSGVLQRSPDGPWKIEQYNLAITVPNELVQDYLELLKD